MKPINKFLSGSLAGRARYRGIFLVWLVLALLPGPGVSQAHLLSLANGKVVTLAEMINDLRRARVVLVGEAHDNPRHHAAQLRIIKALAATGARVALGLEMFRADSQPALDRWISGELNFPGLMKVYQDNWDGSSQYNDIFRAARENSWPMLGLNVSRRIVSQVAQEGFISLSEEELAHLPITRCVVDEAYMRFIERALGGHRQEVDFENFCKAQLLWDTIMARNIQAYLKWHPDATVVVLTGSGHAWKHAIPTQLQKLGETSWRIVLPQIPGRIEPENTSNRDADYLLLGVDEGPLH